MMSLRQNINIFVNDNDSYKVVFPFHTAKTSCENSPNKTAIQ